MIGNSQPIHTNSGPRLAVRFLVQWQNYFRGDVAAFPARMARGLVQRGKAEPVNIAGSDAEPPEGAEWTIRAAAAPPFRQRAAGDDLEDL
jgi:hypothetical protein